MRAKPEQVNPNRSPSRNEFSKTTSSCAKIQYHCKPKDAKPKESIMPTPKILATTNWLRITRPTNGTIKEADSKTRRLDCSEISYRDLVDAKVKTPRVAKKIAVMIENKVYTKANEIIKIIKFANISLSKSYENSKMSNNRLKGHMS